MTATLLPLVEATSHPAAADRVRGRTPGPEVYRRRRLAAVAVLVGLGLGLASFGRQADATPTTESRQAVAVHVVVQPGDTLWGIAESLAPGEDPRPLVAALDEIAGGAAVTPGQLLVVPGDLLG